LNRVEKSVRSLLARPLFTRPDGQQSTGQTIGWWEARRIPFNLAVGAAGLVSLATVFACEIIVESVQHVPAGPMPDPPFFLLVAMLAYGVGANLCYTLGWVVELFVRWIWRERAGSFGPISFVLGLAFSIAFTLLAGVLVIVVTMIGFVVGPQFWTGR